MEFWTTREIFYETRTSAGRVLDRRLILKVEPKLVPNYPAPILYENIPSHIITYVYCNGRKGFYVPINLKVWKRLSCTKQCSLNGTPIGSINVA